MDTDMLIQIDDNILFYDALAQIKEAGFNRVYYDGNSHLINDMEIKCLEEMGLTIGSLHLPFNNPFNIPNSLWRDDINSENAIKLLKTHIDVACHFNIDTVILHPSGGFYPPLIGDKGKHNYESVIEYAIQKEVTVAIENTKRIDYVNYLLSEFVDHYVGFCFDIGHANAFTHNLYCYDWSTLLKRLKAIHLHDNDGKKDQHLLPGMGNIDFKYVFKEIIMPIEAQMDNSVSISLEIYLKGRETCYKRKAFEESFYKLAYESVQKLNL